MPEFNNKRLVIFGEVLYDCFPDGSRVLGGAPFNVAWNLHALGSNPLFISSVGDDSLGESIIEAMRAWGMDLSGLQQDKDHATGTVEVTVDRGEPSYDIVDKRAYDFIRDEDLPSVTPALLYHGTLALRNSVTAVALEKLKQGNPPVFVDVNLRTPWWNSERVLSLLQAASWVKLNEEELASLQKDNANTGKTAEHFLQRFDLDALLITRGADGAALLGKQGIKATVQPASSTAVVDTVGAGDAFTSVILMAQMMGWSNDIAMRRAQDFASAVVGLRGATTQDREFYKNFINAWKLTDL